MLSYARAASEPPKPIKSGIFNPPKSIILPVEEEKASEFDQHLHKMQKQR